MKTGIAWKCAKALTAAAIAVPGLFALAAAFPIRAQPSLPPTPPEGDRPSFEVASIHVNKSPAALPGAHLYGNRFNATLPARNAIMMAYGLNSNDQLSGGPDWIRSVLFEIDAKVEEPLFFDNWKKLSFDQQWAQSMLMLQSLLADRFRLTVRHESRELPVYELLLAKGGLKLTEDPVNKAWGVTALGRGKFKVTAATLDTFANVVLASQPELGGRQILDKTGLQGRYNFTFEFTPEMLAAGKAEGSAPPESSAPSLFTALKEQLGLRLEAAKGPVDTLVIEHIEQPTEN